MLLKYDHFYLNCILFCAMLNNKQRQLSAAKAFKHQCYTEVADLLVKPVLTAVEGEGQSFFVNFNEGCDS